MLDWLIVGGGIHGTLMANFLLSHKTVKHSKLRILDPYPELLYRWRECTDNCGMQFLRSTVVHHLDVDPFSLKKFSKKVKNTVLFTAPYNRPSLKLFNTHCQHVIEKNSLHKLHDQSMVTNIKVLPQHIEVMTEKGTLQTKRLIFATGTTSLNMPKWSHFLCKSQVQHIFTPHFCRKSLQGIRSIIVVGSGITAAQTAIAIAKQDPDAQVTMISQHKPRIHQFDSEPGWIGGHLKEFHSITNFQKRRDIIKHARHHGSMPKDMAILFKNMVASKKINHVVDKIVSTFSYKKNIEVKTTNRSFEADKIILATGFCKKRPGGQWLDKVIEKLQLPQAPCGYPIVSKNLHWKHNIFVMGPLAELQIGPAARNIVGARLAAKLIREIK